VQKTSKILASGIDTLFGAASSAETIAMIPLAAQAKVPHIVTMSADDRITGSNKTRYTFRTSNNLGMENVLVAAQIKNGKMKKVYGVASDVGVTRESWNNIRDDVAKAGVQIAGEDFPPMGSKDYSIIVDKALRSGADAVVFVGAGNDAVGFLKQAHEVGLTKKAQILGPVLIDDTVAKAVGPASEGVMSALRYHASLDNAANKRFVEAYRKKFGELPDMVAGEAYR
jgi:branched-chain amino acid transport system substrate-binding protein